MAKTRDRAAPRRINLALQGGGSHGAFTWGVLDRLLEEPRIEIVGVTGASAGAMNAVVLAEGYCGGDRDGARAALTRFWTRIGEAAAFSPIKRSPLGQAAGAWSLDTSPGYLFFDLLSRLASPYDLNPFDFNPLRDVLSGLVDFDRVRACRGLEVFISATNVRTGRSRVFSREEIGVNHVLASACLPFMFKAVEIDGAEYWDGGFMGNPPLYPLFDASPADDVVIVQINPFERPESPRSAREILNRLNEITFNASLIRELRAIDFVSRLIDAGRMEGTGYRNVFVHMIGDETTLAALGASSKLNAEPAFLTMLRDSGRRAAEQWLETHFDALGARSSLDLAALFGDETDALAGERIDRVARYTTGEGDASGPGEGDAPGPGEGALKRG